MLRVTSKTRASVLFPILFLCITAHPAGAAELEKKTAAAYDRYISASDERMRTESQNGPFLYIDGLPEARRAQAYAELRQGAILVKQATTLEEGHPIEVPHGLIHDWAGVIFVPRASLAQALAVLQDYNDYKDFFNPEIRQSKLLSRNGDNFKVFLQLYKKSILTVAINADFDSHYERIGPNRILCRSYATRLAEVQQAGKPDEHELPPADEHGFLWRLCDYWRLEERDGGVYIQLESVGLSRGVPTGLGWLIDPLLGSIPRGTLSSLLGAARAAIRNRL